MLRAIAGLINPANVNITGGNSTLTFVQANSITVTQLITAVSITPSGPITPNATIGIIGVTTGSNANAGSVGQYITATVATPGTALTTTVSANIASITVTAGDWDLAAAVDYLLTAATATEFKCGPSIVTGTLPTQPGGSGLGSDALIIDPSNFITVTDTLVFPISSVRLLAAATTVVFLVANAIFAAGTISAFGSLSARRMR